MLQGSAGGPVKIQKKMPAFIIPEKDGSEQKDIAEAASHSKYSGHASEPRRVSMGN